MAHLIKQNGEVTQVEPKQGDEFTLEELQGYVDGYIEFVYLGDDIAVVNEEGLLKGLAINNRASAVVGQTLVGDVLIVNRNQIN
jgi:hypothetical protein